MTEQYIRFVVPSDKRVKFNELMKVFETSETIKMMTGKDGIQLSAMSKDHTECYEATIRSGSVCSDEIFVESAMLQNALKEFPRHGLIIKVSKDLTSVESVETGEKTDTVNGAKRFEEIPKEVITDRIKENQGTSLDNAELKRLLAVFGKTDYVTIGRCEDTVVFTSIDDYKSQELCLTRSEIPAIDMANMKSTIDMAKFRRVIKCAVKIGYGDLYAGHDTIVKFTARDLDMDVKYYLAPRVED